MMQKTPRGVPFDNGKHLGSGKSPGNDQGMVENVETYPTEKKSRK
jgi:hypothetical protein